MCLVKSEFDLALIMICLLRRRALKVCSDCIFACRALNSLSSFSPLYLSRNIWLLKREKVCACADESCTRILNVPFWVSIEKIECTVVCIWSLLELSINKLQISNSTYPARTRASLHLHSPATSKTTVLLFSLTRRVKNQKGRYEKVNSLPGQWEFKKMNRCPLIKWAYILVFLAFYTCTHSRLLIKKHRVERYMEPYAQ